MILSTVVCRKRQKVILTVKFAYKESQKKLCRYCKSLLFNKRNNNNTNLLRKYIFSCGIYFCGITFGEFCLSSAKTQKFLSVKFSFIKIYQYLLCTLAFFVPRLFLYQLVKKKIFTPWKVSVFGVILVRIFPHSDWIRGKRVAIKVKTNESYINLLQKATTKFRTFHKDMFGIENEYEANVIQSIA